MTKRRKMWAVTRDGAIFLIVTTKRRAMNEHHFLSLGGASKHSWSLRSVIVTYAEIVGDRK
jgi:hypothetical protein